MDKGRDRVNVYGVYRLSIFYKRLKYWEILYFIFVIFYKVNICIIDDYLNIFELNRVLCFIWSFICIFIDNFFFINFLLRIVNLLFYFVKISMKILCVIG